MLTTFQLSSIYSADLYKKSIFLTAINMYPTERNPKNGHRPL